jgi:hypothetical protein
MIVQRVNCIIIKRVFFFFFLLHNFFVFWKFYLLVYCFIGAIEYDLSTKEKLAAMKDTPFKLKESCKYKIEVCL